MDRIKKFLFTNQNTRQTIAKNMFWLASSTTLSRVIRSIVIIFAARLLGTEGYGAFTYAMSLAALFTIFSDIGLTGILTRELAKSGEKDRTFISTIAFVKLGFLSIATILIATVGSSIARLEEARSLMLIIAVLLAFDSLRSFIYSIARSQSRMQVEAGLEIITEICITVACIIALIGNPSAQSLALGYMIGSGAGVLISLFGFRSNLRNIFSHFNRSFLSPIITSALPFAVIGVFNVFMTNIDSVILGIWSDAHTLGLFGAAQRPISVLYLLPGFLGTSLFPIISRLSEEKDTVRINTLIQKSLMLALMFALPIVVGGILIANPLINAVFGYSYIGAVSTFQILLLTLLPIFPGIVFYYGLFAENRQKIFLRSSLCGALINIALDFLLIPKYGIVGSAVATLCAQLVVNIILLREIRKTYHLTITKKIFKISIATAGMSIVTAFLVSFSVPLLIIIPLAAAFYFSILILLKERLILDVRETFRV